MPDLIQIKTKVIKIDTVYLDKDRKKEVKFNLIKELNYLSDDLFCIDCENSSIALIFAISPN